MLLDVVVGGVWWPPIDFSQEQDRLDRVFVYVFSTLVRGDINAHRCGRSYVAAAVPAAAYDLPKKLAGVCGDVEPVELRSGA